MLSTQIRSMKQRMRKSMSFASIKKRTNLATKCEESVAVEAPPSPPRSPPSVHVAVVPHETSEPASEAQTEEIGLVEPPGFTLRIAEGSPFAEQVVLGLRCKCLASPKMTAAAEAATYFDSTELVFPDGSAVKGATRILSRLDSLFPDPDFHDRISPEFTQACRVISSTVMRCASDGAHKDFQTAVVDLNDALDILVAHIGAAQTFFGGQKLSRSDILLAPMLRRVPIIARLHDTSFPQLAVLKGYLTELERNPVVAECLPSIEDMTRTMLRACPSLAHASLLRMQRATATQYLSHTVHLAADLLALAQSKQEWQDTTALVHGRAGPFSALDAFLKDIKPPAARADVVVQGQGVTSVMDVAARAGELMRRVEIVLPLLGQEELFWEFRKAFGGIVDGLGAGMKLWPRIWLKGEEVRVVVEKLAHVDTIKMAFVNDSRVVAELLKEAGCWNEYVEFTAM
ncbi:hypothetical protein BC830DRAFT_1168367 [Chytriomyces sp. MP71]|nr:hypothetical protein BC830DRAFT_1168367 [Chytriomyces sp. MP71]